MKVYKFELEEPVCGNREVTTVDHSEEHARLRLMDKGYKLVPSFEESRFIREVIKMLNKKK